MSMNDLHVLHAYVRLVELGSFTTVADELGVAQPTVSRWIAGLEEALGVQLLERTTRSLTVLPAGARFFEQAREVLAAHERAVAAAQEEAYRLHGTLRLGLPAGFGEHHVLPLLPDFLDAHPDLRLELCWGERAARLLDDGLDAVVQVTPTGSAPAGGRTLARAPLRLVAAPALAHGLREPADLAALPGLLDATAAEAGWSLTRPSERTQLRLRARVCADRPEALRSLALAGQGIARLPSWAVDQDIAAGRLVALLPDWDAGTVEVQLLTPAGRLLPPRTRALSDHLAATLPHRLQPPV